MKFVPKKSLGQNFLKDENIIKKICDVGKIEEKNFVLEIGPGTGKLTEAILIKKPRKIHLIEKDKRLIDQLTKKLQIMSKKQSPERWHHDDKNTKLGHSWCSPFCKEFHTTCHYGIKGKHSRGTGN